MWTRVRRFVADDKGQDLVEYALLAAFITLASVAGVSALRTTLCESYVTWNEGAQGCSTMPAPNSEDGGCVAPTAAKLSQLKQSCP